MVKASDIFTSDEISKIKVIDVEVTEGPFGNTFNIKINYNGKDYEIKRKYSYFEYPVEFKKDFKKFTSVIMPLSQFPAAAAQGCIALEYRSNNKNLKKILEKINHHESYQNCVQEREFLAHWGGGCSLDIGATIEQNVYRKILFSRGRDNKKNCGHR